MARSVLLRGFDGDCVKKVEEFMIAQGIRIIKGVTPTRIEKLASGRLLVTFSSGEAEEFDTVLGAIGRQPDLKLLGIDQLSVDISPKSGKIICHNEQSSVPNIYAIGDVVDGAPELTPVAILAGRLLAKRLFGGRDQRMVYSDIATAVFTPLELGTVGLSEEEAISKYGEESIDCYISSFQPLEWSVPHVAEFCIAKIVVNIKDGEKVLGIHIASPNAGEIIQGYAVAFRKGISHTDLLNTVGIHPTIAEEFTTMEISKSSGKSTEKAGC
jgi:thioredoxin reductase (NADPH)